MQTWKEMGECFMKFDDYAKKLAEEGNKLQPLDCVTKLKVDGCKVYENLGKDEDKFMECKRIGRKKEAKGMYDCDPIDPKDNRMFKGD